MFLSTLPLWISVVLLGLAAAVLMLGPIIVRRRVDLHKLTTNNEIAGFKFATVGVLYAVYLASRLSLFGKNSARPKRM